MPEPKTMQVLSRYRDMTPDAVWDEMMRARREEWGQQDRIHALEVQQADLIRQAAEKDAEIRCLRADLALALARRVRDEKHEQLKTKADQIKALADAGMAVIEAVGIMTEEDSDGVTARLAEALPKAVEELCRALRLAGRLP